MLDYKDWHERINCTLEWRSKYWNGDAAWKRYMALYRGDHWRNSRYGDSVLGPDSDSPRTRITVNVTGATILLAKSFLFKKKPQFIIEPKLPEHYVSAVLQQATLNYEWKERNMQKQAKKAVLDSLVIGHGIIKTGFTYEPSTANNPKKDGQTEYREYIEKDTPYIERINPFMFLFDIETDTYDLENGSWCAQIFFRPYNDVVVDTNYDKGVLKAIKSNLLTPETFKMGLAMSVEEYARKENNQCALYEVWDKKYKKRYVFIKGIEEPVEEQDWPYEYLDGFPYEKLDFIPLINEPYGIGIPAFIEDQQYELNRVRTAMYDHRRRFNRKYLARKGAIDSIELDKFLNSETASAIWVESMDAIRPTDEATIPNDAYAVEATIKNDIQELTGVDQLVRGGQLPARTSAAEVNARVQFSNLKLDDRVDDVDSFIINIGRKTLQHIKENYSSEKIIKINGPAGEYWTKYSPTDIKAEFDIDMDTVSAPQIDPVADRQQAIQIFTLIMQNLQILLQQQVQINIGELFKWLLGKFDEKDISRFFPQAGVISGPIQTVTEGQTNTAQNLPQLNMPQQPPVMNAQQLRGQLNGNLSGGGPNNFIPGIQ